VAAQRIQHIAEEQERWRAEARDIRPLGSGVRGSCLHWRFDSGNL